MTYTESALEITGVNEPAIINYFATINQELFSKTAALFTEAGELLAPFESPIVGRENIAAYLSKEAKGMLLVPKQGSKEVNSDSTAYKITGKVKTSLFSVNVAWNFVLNSSLRVNTLPGFHF